ncbi:DUF6527 family protein [Ciceribacter ferrooxidans]|uniref:Uncharacterized protein n=1 Tax=Ciceribacter ferrooxidans TaxID=2509717 RepID=A0A4Q2SZM3_9HYPH|nr:DUF6527 family protein [Ciceribacter ferrooxidans]RYC10084.1 hypothetical protein EUU22_18600 [Ciceribacter ferrooxidans]
MSEIRTPPVTAVLFEDRDDFFRSDIAGSIHIARHEDDPKEVSFWYRCPCGCGAKAPLSAGDGYKPVDGPSWTWNGSTTAPTLTPSVHHVGHWHGWLTDGVWKSC